MATRSAGGAPAPWLPEAWGAPATTRPADAGAGDSFVAGWAADLAPPAEPRGGASTTSPAVSQDVFDALPDFGAARRRALDTNERAWADLVAAAADEREALVRAELEEAYGADLAAREAAHGELLERAWADGHAAGRDAGAADAHAAFAATAAALDAAVREVRAHEERWAGDLAAHVAALATAVARHVIGREVAADDALVVALAARAVAEFPTPEALVVRAHPDDVGALQAAWAAAPRAGALRWAPDARVARGGVLVEGGERIVDGRVDAALERVYRALAGQVA